MARGRQWRAFMSRYSLRVEAIGFALPSLIRAARWLTSSAFFAASVLADRICTGAGAYQSAWATMTLAWLLLRAAFEDHGARAPASGALPAWRCARAAGTAGSSRALRCTRRRTCPASRAARSSAARAARGHQASESATARGRTKQARGARRAARRFAWRRDAVCAVPTKEAPSRDACPAGGKQTDTVTKVSGVPSGKTRKRRQVGR